MNVHTMLERRNAVRVLAHCHIHYREASGNEVSIEEGLLRDVSTTGCTIISKATLRKGSIITLTLYLNDGQPPISLAGTTVSWAVKHRFGVTFPEMTSDERERLQMIVWNGLTLLGKSYLL